MSKRKQTCIDLKRKIEILEEVDRRLKSKTEITKYFNIPKSTLSTIIKNKELIYETITSGTVTPKAKRIRRAQHEDVEAELLTWFHHMRVSNIPISGPLIQEKALSIADNLGVENFNCSSGWLWRFQVRHGISSQAVCGELNKVNEQHANNWLATFENIKQKFSSRDIFNVDETGIFFNLYPNRTLSLKGEKCHGGNKSKQRITAVFVCNSDGSEKLPAWIIGKSKQPRCFKHIDLSTFNCQYTHHQNSWIDAAAFRKWLLKFNSRMISQNRHVLLTLDNCTAHDVNNMELSNITIEFFPANTTSRLQPLDQGIIALIKKDYRKRLVRAAIQAIESHQKARQWNILDAIRAIILAWDSVSAENIKKCFIKAWSQSDIDQSSLMEVIIDDSSCVEWEYLQSIDNAKDNCTFNEFVEIDNDIAVCNERGENIPPDSTDADEQEEEKEEEIKKPSRSVVMSAFQTLKNYAATNNVSNKFVDHLENMSFEYVLNNPVTVRQKTIKDYFHRNN